MAIYAIGDVQGCYDELRRLLDKIRFDPAEDTLWFCGDLVNRGPQSLQTLSFVKSLDTGAVTVLGNHDLHLLALHRGVNKINDCDYLQPILDSPDRDQLMHWLQTRPLLHYDKTHKALMVHAGIHPEWTLKQAQELAGEIETRLQGAKANKLLRKMYGNGPSRWSPDLKGSKRHRCIINVLTRMRFFNQSGKLKFKANGSPRQHPRLTPWFELGESLKAEVRIIFGHWSSLPVGCYGRHFALDGGCVWGGHLVAMRLDHAAEEFFFADAPKKKQQT